MNAAADVALCHRLLADMLRVRRMEEMSAQLYGQSRIRGFLHLYVGEEAVAVGVLHSLTEADNVVATYREHAHALVRGVSMKAIMAEMFGKASGCSRGRGGSMHLFDRATHFYGGNGIVGGGLAIATGLALAAQLQQHGSVTTCFFGEGAMAEGIFHESMNLAALWRLPVLFVCENNLYAMGTALARSQSQTDLCAKADAYKVAHACVDGMDVLAVHAAALSAAQQVRSGHGPFFLECQTYRFRAHSMYDPDLYRDPAEIAQWKLRGPLHSFTQRLKEASMLSEAQFLALDAQAQQEVDEAVAFADAAAPEAVSDLLRHVTAAGDRP